MGVQRYNAPLCAGMLTGKVVACITGTPVRMPARGSVTIASLPHVAPHVRWFSGVVAADFDPSLATSLGALWQVTLLDSCHVASKVLRAQACDVQLVMHKRPDAVGNILSLRT